MEVLKQWSDLLDKEPTCIRQRNASRSAIEQSHSQPCLEPAYRVAQSGGRNAEIDGGCSECPTPGNRDGRFQLFHACLVHGPDLFIAACRFIPLIRAMVES
jgi:hypothetical protein